MSVPAARTANVGLSRPGARVGLKRVLGPDHRLGLLFVAPFLLLYLAILIFPLFRGVWLSLHRIDLFGAGHFIGLGNYARLLGDPIFQQSLINTFVVTLMIVPPLTIIALALAIALNRAGPAGYGRFGRDCGQGRAGAGMDVAARRSPMLGGSLQRSSQ